MVIGGRYRLDNKLGAGAAAQVWSALDTTLHALVALKLLDPTFAESGVAKRFLREARAAAQIRSLHVVQILDHGLHEGTPFIAMELLEGETLADRLDRVKTLAPAMVVRIVTQIAKAAAKAHTAGIVHRDLKPPNVFLVKDDDTDEEIAKVFDFGIAKVEVPLDVEGVPQTGVTRVGTLLGTPHYMSPEQAIGVPVDYRTDIYALGIIAFECMTGAIPVEGDDIVSVLRDVRAGRLRKPSEVAHVPRAFDAWFAKATKVLPEERFNSAKELADALRVALVAQR